MANTRPGVNRVAASNLFRKFSNCAEGHGVLDVIEAAGFTLAAGIYEYATRKWFDRSTSQRLCAFHLWQRAQYRDPRLQDRFLAARLQDEAELMRRVQGGRPMATKPRSLPAKFPDSYLARAVAAQVCSR